MQKAGNANTDRRSPMPINSFEHYPMSWRPALQRGGLPLYQALAAQLEADIQSGLLRPGTKLPPQRELADFLDINISTVTRAFKLCANKGLLSSAVGSGTFVSYDVNTSTLILPETQDAPLIELGSMMPETLPQADAIALLHQMAAEAESSRLFQYQYGREYRHKQAAAQLLERVHLSVTAPEQLLFAGGGQNALAAIFAGLFHAGDRLGVDPLVYPGVKGAAKLFGVQLIPLPQENGEISPDGLLAACKNEGIKGVYLMPDLQNPTNHTMSAECRRAIARIAEAQDLLLLEDGINSLLLRRPLLPIAAYAPAHTLYFLSLSKTILPALRLAYLHVPARFVPAVEQALYHMNLSQSALLLELASRMILSDGLDRLMETRRRGILTRNHLAERVLAGYPLAGDGECLSRWLSLPEGMSGAAFEARARALGVSVYGCERFAVGQAAPAGAARLAICAPPTLAALEEGLLRLRQILEEG